MFEDGTNRPVDFIVVGPLEDDTKRVTGLCIIMLLSRACSKLSMKRCNLAATT